MRQAGLVRFHFSRHEDEACHAEAEANEGDVGDAVFQNDVDVAVEAGGIGGPPEVDPVVVHLLVNRLGFG